MVWKRQQVDCFYYVQLVDVLLSRVRRLYFGGNDRPRITLGYRV